jgi:uncharacterized protein
VDVRAERHTVAIPGGRLALAVHLPDRPDAAPCVVACHGLSASKDSDKYLMLGDAMPAAGIALARFDFRGCGESTGIEEETTVGTRLEDAEAVIAYLEAHPRLSGDFGLLGSSMGGFVALHVAARRQRGLGAGSGNPVVTWNAPGDLSDLATDERADDKAIGVPFFMELAARTFETTPAGVARHLVIHGDADEVVPIDHGVVLHSRAAEPCDIVVIPGADHRITDPGHRRLAVEASVAWFQQFILSPEPSTHD